MNENNFNLSNPQFTPPPPNNQQFTPPFQNNQQIASPQKSKKKKGCLTALLCVVGAFAAFMALIMIVAIFSGDETTTPGTTTSISDTENAQSKLLPEELIQYLGQTPDDLASALDVEIQDMTEYFTNTFRVNNKKNIAFEVVTDNEGKIITIKLYETGKEGYTVCGLKSDARGEAANTILKEKGFVSVRENVWRNEAQTDMIKLEENKWIYEKNSVNLENEILRAEAEKNFTPQYNDNALTLYLGNGQIVEVFHDSYPTMTFNYSQLTDYQKSETNKVINGRYVIVTGEIEEVSADGVLNVFCKDEELMKEHPWGGSSNAYVTLNNAQKDELVHLQKGQTVTIIAQIQADSFISLIGINSFHLNNGILFSIGEHKMDIPILETTNGLYRFSPQS